MKMNEEMIIPVVHGNQCEKVKLYFDNIEKTENYITNLDTLVLEVNPALRFYFKCDSDPCLHQQGGRYRLDGIGSLAAIIYNGSDVEIL